jgi:threonine/homoserine/homoserine lactone efflux protein
LPRHGGIIAGADTALWAKPIIEVIWYDLVAMLLSTPGARAVYARLGRWIERLIGTLLVGFGLRLVYDRS